MSSAYLHIDRDHERQQIEQEAREEHVSEQVSELLYSSDKEDQQAVNELVTDRLAGLSDDQHSKLCGILIDLAIGRIVTQEQAEAVLSYDELERMLKPIIESKLQGNQNG